MRSTEIFSLAQHCSGEVRVLMANEPRAYRESISETLCALYPDIGVTSVQPDALESSVMRDAPHMVICSEAIPIVRDTVPVWVELYPGHSSKSIVSIEGGSTEIEDIQLTDLFDIVDQARDLAKSG